ncbi:MAG: tetratricopeptide repeat protein, partial [Candidatus Odinarchaeota archaeon]
NLGVLYKDQGKEKEAEETWLKAGILEAWTNLGVLYKDQGKEKEAEETWLKAGILEAWNNLGELYKDQGKEKEAIDAFRTALDLAPAGWPYREDIEKHLGELEKEDK